MQRQKSTSRTSSAFSAFINFHNKISTIPPNDMTDDEVVSCAPHFFI